MTKLKLLLLLMVGILAVAACSQADDGIEQVTSIPDDAIMAPTNTPPVVSNINNNSSAEDSSGNSADVATNPTATPEPLDNNLGSGEARVIAQATDQAYQPTPRHELVFDEYPVEITFNEFYDGFNMRTGLVLSDKLVTLDGDRVVMEGYVAPPLKPKLDFFVLTSIPLASCPFCSTAADWPDDVALIYLTEEEIVYTPYPVRVFGRMEIGSSVDAESGMVSLVRIYADELEILD